MLQTHQNPLSLISLFPFRPTIHYYYQHQQPFPNNNTPFLSPLTVSHRPTPSLSLHRTQPNPSWLARAEPPDSIPDGPIELPSSTPSILATTDDPTPLQVATSVLLTGAISVFLFRSVRRRAKRLKETKFRSSGAKKTLKEEALDSLKVMGSAPVQPKAAPTAVQTLLGGLTAGVIALILYKFTTTIEASLNRQTLSDNYSVRQITITIRTIVNGLCYLATFVFGLNSIGLFLLSGQLALNSIMGGSSSKDTETSGEEQSTPTESSVEGDDLSGESGNQESKDPQ